MAKLGCPCGNQLWNGCDGDETEYDFVPFSVFEENYDKCSFFDLRNEDEGYIYNNLLFNSMDSHFTWEWERSGKAFDYTCDYLCPRRIEEEVFSGKNGRYRDWWYCRNYADYIVFYGTRKMDVPLKAWMRYEQVWEKDER